MVMASSMELHKSINNQLLSETKPSLLLNRIEFKLTENDANFDEHRRLKSMYTYMAPDVHSNQSGAVAGSATTTSKFAHFNGSNKPVNGHINNVINHHATTAINGSKGDGIPGPKHTICTSDRIQLEWKQFTKIGAGYINLGNTCFMNSVLQCLTHCPPLVNYLLYSKEDHIESCKVISFCMTCELVRHMRRAIDHSGDAIRPNNIFQRLKSIAKHFQHGRQEDSHEFLRYVIDNIWKSCVMNWESSHSVKLDAQSKETTFINQIFGGYHRSQITCLCCNAKSNTYDYFMDFILDIKSLESLEKALDKFIQPEVLQNENAYKCTKCNKKVSARKRFTVHRAPNVATFQLKRFDYNRIFGGKITKHISYPEKFNLRPYMSEPKGPPINYRLNAVLVHLGSTSNSGHYFCYVRGCNNSWYLMDDSKVSSVNLNHVLRQQAYILFYVREPSKNPLPQEIASPNSVNNVNRSNQPSTVGKQIPKIQVTSPLPAKHQNRQFAAIRQFNSLSYVNNSVTNKSVASGTCSSTPNATGIQRSSLNQPKMISDEPIKRSLFQTAQNVSTKTPIATPNVPTNGTSTSNYLSTLVPYGDDSSSSQDDEDYANDKNNVRIKIDSVNKSSNGLSNDSSLTNGHSKITSTVTKPSISESIVEKSPNQPQPPVKKEDEEEEDEKNEEKQIQSANRAFIDGVSRVVGDRVVAKNDKQKKRYVNNLANFANQLCDLFGVDPESALKDMENGMCDDFTSTETTKEEKAEISNKIVLKLPNSKSNETKAAEPVKEKSEKAKKPKGFYSNDDVYKLVPNSQTIPNIKIKSTSSSWTALDANQVESPSVASGSSTMSGSTTEWRVIDQNDAGALKKHFQKQTLFNGRKMIVESAKAKSGSLGTSSSSSSSGTSSASSSNKSSVERSDSESQRNKRKNENEHDNEQRKRKKSKKHKKRKADDSDELEWIERTKETLEKDQLSGTTPAFKSPKYETNTVDELKKMRFGMYGKNVCTWSGDRTELDKIVAEQMRNDLRRDKTDAYNEEYDRGKNKKVKAHRPNSHSRKNGSNPFEKAYKKKYM